MNLERQIRRLLTLEVVGYFRPAGCIWVLLLANRGFTLAEIGLAEGFFHLVSLCCEIPSGLLADLLGRRRALAIGQLMGALAALTMIFSRAMAGVCLCMGLLAASYNLASGTREAISYDSLLLHGAEGEYLKLSSRQNMVYRLTTGAAMLCAGVTAALGYRVGYALDILFALAAAGVALSLHEPLVTEGQRAGAQAGLHAFPRRLGAHIRATAAFLYQNPKSVRLMLFNAAAGAFATLLGFYLQDGLARAGAPAASLGLLLVAVGLGGAAGSRLAPWLARLSYRSAAMLTCAGVLCGYLMVATAFAPVMALGGFLAVAGDDALQTLTDARLNQGLPSDQRSTLISVSSMCFSVVMLVLSPLAGALAG
ncbi:MAG TPA: MFS transporter [Pseudoflavonifractor sp.]|nr:MFS transporter [Pseudoflavonifractor sp.]